MENSRRNFLKIAGFSALGLGTKPVLDAFAKEEAQATLPEYQIKKGAEALTARQWAMVVDTRKFESSADLEPLVEACHKIHNVPKFENKRHEIKWIWAEEYHNAFPMKTARFVSEKVEHTPFVVLCNHCEKHRIDGLSSLHRMQVLHGSLSFWGQKF
jgi:molybdopterin-containing oxidoreductase family iron-sulfur binding subunit